MTCSKNLCVPSFSAQADVIMQKKTCPYQYSVKKAYFTFFNVFFV